MRGPQRQTSSPIPRCSLSPHSVEPTAEAASFLNTTFSLHRISPLFVGREPLTAERLGVFAGRLRDTLVGDVVRGIELGLDAGGSTVGRAGALEVVTVEWVAVDGIINTAREGIQLSLQYENAMFTALLLPTLENKVPDEQFIHFPLLLLRMPAPLKAVMADFLANAFDCRISNLKIKTGDIVRSWEGWVRDAGLAARGPLAKDVVLTLGFHLPQQGTAAGADAKDESGKDELGIKAIDIIIPNQDLGRFLRAGQTGEGSEQPFASAVARYLENHLALDMSHPGVQITRIAVAASFSRRDASRFSLSRTIPRAILRSAQPFGGFLEA